MHGVKRSRLTSEAKAQRKAKELSKLQAYLALEEKVFAARQENLLTEDSLELTGRVLALNPEHYTAWNFRRKVLEHLFAGPIAEVSPKDFFAAAREEGKEQAAPHDQTKRWLLDADLELTEHALRSHPKVYWIWNHRKWCLESYPIDDVRMQAGEGSTAGPSRDALVSAAEAKWRREMKLVDRMLELDGRNFHGWDYRRYLLCQVAAAQSLSLPQGSPPPFPDNLSDALLQSELAYTLTKIEKDISNFSAWHQRQLVLKKCWSQSSKANSEKAMGKQKADLDNEFELIQQAMYTDPSDQSVWQYHRWLVEQDLSVEVLDREIQAVQELLEVEPDSKWCMLSIVHYLSMRRSARSSHGAIQTKDLDEEMKLLRKLLQVDPDRKRRYEDEVSRRNAAGR